MSVRVRKSAERIDMCKRTSVLCAQERDVGHLPCLVESEDTVAEGEDAGGEDCETGDDTAVSLHAEWWGGGEEDGTTHEGRLRWGSRGGRP